MDEILLDEKELTLALKEAWRDVYHSNPDFVMDVLRGSAVHCMGVSPNQRELSNREESQQ